MKKEETLPCEPQEQCLCAPPPPPPTVLWIITYVDLANRTYRGIAVVQAPDIHIAESVFLSNSSHNGSNSLRIESIREVYKGIGPELLAEVYLEAVPNRKCKNGRI